ncbi:MAG: hypothetical protein KIT02_06140 [Devosia sp.]|uniref:hypothetical protein n=1 Tax=Devosia sp. TaxID=1871048 RepID=UPI0024C7DCC4|nr:hypothetical protein [Devosia sp.]UYO00785.1 MAG: hypothetical protein KIT02_06140 [Devosia sp.]
MTFKEMMAGVQLAGVVVVVGWLAWDFATGGAEGLGMAGVAIKLLWAVGGLVTFNIVGTILATIIISIIRREELKDEPADERDVQIEARSLRNSGIVTSVAAALSLIPLAMGTAPEFAAYALFLAPVFGGTINALSQLYYYRTM